MHTTRIRRLAARWVLEIVHPSEVIDFAHRLLDAGTYTYSLGELATLPAGWERPTFERYFRGAVQELGAEMPDELNAVEVLLSQALEWCCEGQVMPRESLRVCDLLAGYGGWDELETILNGAGCGELCALYFQLDHDERTHPGNYVDDPAFEARMRVIDDQVLTVAEHWLTDRWRKAIHPTVRTSGVVGLAMAIDADRAFDRLPILADALEDAGCTNAEVLEHLRQPQEHVRGCWVVDLLLGKQ